MLADKRYCYPLPITDFASRYLLACEALHTTKEVYAFTVFERRVRLTPCDQNRQRRALRQPQCTVQSFPVIGVVAQAWHRH